MSLQGKILMTNIRITITLILLVLLFISMTVNSSNVKLLILLLLVLSTALLSIKSPGIGASILVGCLPLSGVIRWSDHENIVSAGYLSILIAALSCAVFLRIIFVKGKVCTFSLNTYWLVFLPFFAILLAHIFLASGGFAALFAMLRNYLIPFFSFFIFVEAIKSCKDMKKNLLVVLYITSLFVVVVNFIHYFYGLDIAITRFVMISEEDPAIRGYGSVTFPRMNHILGLGPQGAGGVFYGIIALIGIYLMASGSNMAKIFLAMSTFIFLVAIFFIGSVSGMVTLLIGAGILTIIHNRRLIPVMAFPVIICFTLGLFYIPVPLAGYSNIASYAYIGFIANIVNDASDYSPAQFFLGNELGLTGGGVQSVTIGFFDRWVFGVFLQLGLIAFISMSLWYAIVIFAAFKKTYSPKEKEFAVFALLIFFGSLTYGHQSALMQPLFVPLLMLAVSLLYKKPI